MSASRRCATMHSGIWQRMPSHAHKRRRHAPYDALRVSKRAGASEPTCLSLRVGSDRQHVHATKDIDQNLKVLGCIGSCTALWVATEVSASCVLAWAQIRALQPPTTPFSRMCSSCRASQPFCGHLALPGHVRPPSPVRVSTISRRVHHARRVGRYPSQCEAVAGGGSAATSENPKRSLSGVKIDAVEPGVTSRL